MLGATGYGKNRWAKSRRDDAASIQGFQGTLIHNGKCGPTPAICSLPVALIQSSFPSLSMAEVCSSTLLSAGFGAATLTAILLAVIAAAADPEDRVTLLPAANSLTENIFSGMSHLHPKARLDNGRRSCQLMDGYLENLSTERKLPMGLGRGHDRGLRCSTFHKKLHDYRDDVTCACGVMMLRGLFRRVFK
jgi:hypothetical protein